MKRLILLAAVLIAVSGCSTKFLPDSESALNPPVAFQQQFIAEAIDDVFSTMNFSGLSGKLVDIEVMGVYVDGDVADYMRSKLQLELAKAGAASEPQWASKDPDYKANIMVRIGGVNDVTKTALFYEWRQKVYTYDVQVALMAMDGSRYFTQSGMGSSEATIGRRFYLIFFPIPLPVEFSPTKGMTFWGQAKQTYDAGKTVYDNPNLMTNQNLIQPQLGP